MTTLESLVSEVGLSVSGNEDQEMLHMTINEAVNSGLGDMMAPLETVDHFFARLEKTLNNLIKSGIPGDTAKLKRLFIRYLEDNRYDLEQSI
jgi:hypothetical protein